MKYVDQKWWKPINEPINDSSIYSQLTIELPSTTNFVALTCTEPINVKKNKQKMCVCIYIYIKKLSIELDKKTTKPRKKIWFPTINKEGFDHKLVV